MKLSSEEIRGHIAMLAFSGFIAGSFSLGALIANDIAPQAVTLARFVFAAIIMGLIAWARREMRREHFSGPWRYLLLGVLFVFYFVLMFEALKTATPVSTAAVFTMMPLMTACFGWLVLRQVTTSRMASALALAGIGAVWVIFRGDVRAIGSFDLGRGEAIYFIGCIAHALYTPLVRRFNRGEGAAVFTFGVLVAGSLVMCVVGFDAVTSTDWTALSPLIWGTLGYLTLFATAVSFFLLQYATIRLPSTKVVAYSYLTPAWVILWELGLGGELPSMSVLAGIVITVVALLMLLRNEGEDGASAGDDARADDR